MHTRRAQEDMLRKARTRLVGKKRLRKSFLRRRIQLLECRMRGVDAVAEVLDPV